MYTQDTICAVATAQGGAIGIMPYTLTFGTIRDAGGEVVDEVLVSLFRAPHSYTGEDSVEISCHGSSYILQQVMQLLIRNGCRAAGLSQAEAVADLIASSSAATHRLAMNQMKGGFSKELAALREKLLHLTSLMELELDFSDHEELEFADRSELKAIAAQIEQVIGGLVRSFSTGNAIKNGIPVAIIGETNAGKSTLLNALLNEERAIVSDIHGTTRDVIEVSSIPRASARPPTPSRVWASSGASRSWSRQTSSFGSSTVRHRIPILPGWPGRFCLVVQAST